jgi:acetoin utilization deacetylase AcuC-like enzyme
MLIYYTDHYVLPLPAGHRFPMRKYALLRERAAAQVPDLLAAPDAATDEQLALAHDRGYIDAVVAGRLDATSMRRIGFPWSAQMVERSRRSAGATIAACRAALVSGCGINLAGGTHHAHRDAGFGFCVFNDSAVAARAMQAECRVRRVLIVDLDVHQGDGTAAILAGDDSIFTFSMHGRNNFPFRKTASRLDVELDDGTGDGQYLAALEAALPRALERSSPDLAIYLAGADPYVGDRFGRLALSKEGLAARDRYVLQTLRARGVPAAISMAGGYAAAIEDVVDIHFRTITIASELYAGRAVLDSRLHRDGWRDASLLPRAHGCAAP